MRLITGITIRGLRSFQNETLDELGSLTVLVGRNSSGKSNVLRALNLFFNDEIEPGKVLALQRDFHSRPQARRKKTVVISVDFQLPTSFRFRKSLAAVQAALSSNFTIRRTWELDARQETAVKTEVIVNGNLLGDSDTVARQFLALVTFRYIPNRTVPAAMLREESRVISASIFARIRGDSGAQNVMTAMKTAADRLLEQAGTSMASTGASLTDVTIASPASLADMLSVAGFQAKGFHGNVVRDEEWGAGNQAFFLYEVLKAVDTNYSRTFGWKQIAIWGVEEPESGLHRDLETRLAEEMRVWSADPSLRLQIIQTTHSPVFTMASEVGYWIELESGASTARRTPISRLVRDAERKGVTGWVQPILAYPMNPVVLVEGPIDVDALTHTASLVGLDRMRFLVLPELDAAEKGGGKDAIIVYLKRHAGLIGNRPKGCPLVVLFDWEVSAADLIAARKAYGNGAANAVVTMNAAHCHPSMGEDFVGIERFYPPSIVREGHAAGEFVIGEAAQGPIAISTSQFSLAKKSLRARLLQVTSLSDLEPLVKVVRDIDALINTLATAP
jgi:hypothetical protein